MVLGILEAGDIEGASWPVSGQCNSPSNQGGPKPVFREEKVAPVAEIDCV
jgi:hypothetical protein